MKATDCPVNGAWQRALVRTLLEPCMATSSCTRGRRHPAKDVAHLLEVIAEVRTASCEGFVQWDIPLHGALTSHCQEEACQPWKTPGRAQSTDGSALWSPGTGQHAPPWSSSAARTKWQLGGRPFLLLPSLRMEDTPPDSREKNQVDKVESHQPSGLQVV